MEFILLEGNVLVGGQTETKAEVAQPTSDTSGSAPAGGVSYGTMSLILIYVAVFGALYFLTMRPARKRELAIKEKQNQMKINDQVITSGGMHGKIVDINADTFNVEFGTNKGVIIPVSKKDVFPVGLDLEEATTKSKKKDKEKTEETK